MFGSLLNANDDWIETFRRFWYPRLHPYLTSLPGPIPFYAVGHVNSDQFVGTFDVDEEAFEDILVDLGFERNPVACFKKDPHGHQSAGSWVLRAPDPHNILGAKRQLHVTVFNGKAGLEVYAHNEYDWQDQPVKHLRGVNFQPVTGRSQMATLLDEETYLDSLHTA